MATAPSRCFCADAAQDELVHGGQGDRKGRPGLHDLPKLRLCSLDNFVHRLERIAIVLQHSYDSIKCLSFGRAARVHQDDRAIGDLTLDDADDPFRRGVLLPVERINGPHDGAIAQIGGGL